jgi:hypothetical protein
MSAADKLFQHQSDLQTVQRQRQLDWSKRTKAEKWASILWPNNTDDATRAAMTGLAAQEGKAAPKASPLLKDSQRGCVSPLGNLAKQRSDK